MSMEISEIASQSKEIHQWIVDKRRTIHRNPELMYEEFETSRLIQNTLKDLKENELTLQKKLFLWQDRLKRYPKLRIFVDPLRGIVRL